MRRSKKGMFTFMVGLLTVVWVGSVSGGPGMFGLWSGFHADEKGYPGWCPNDQHRKPTDQLEVITIESRVVDDSNGNFHGAGPIGEYPGGRPGP